MLPRLTVSPSGGITVRIETDSSGPSGILVDPGATFNLASPLVANWNQIDTSGLSYEASTIWWIAVTCSSQSSGNYWDLNYRSYNIYNGGSKAESYDGGSSWSVQSSYELKFIADVFPPDMALITEPYEAETEPVESKILFILEDVDAAALNTDVKGYAASAAIAVTGITAANPAVITAAGHELSATDTALILDVSGMTEANGQIITVAGVDGDNVTTDLDAAGFSAYTSGGILVPLNQITLSDAGDWETGQKIVSGSAALPDRTDDDRTTRMVITSENNVEIRIHAAGDLLK